MKYIFKLALIICFFKATANKAINNVLVNFTGAAVECKQEYVGKTVLGRQENKFYQSFSKFKERVSFCGICFCNSTIFDKFSGIYFAIVSYQKKLKKFNFAILRESPRNKFRKNLFRMNFFQSNFL